jgi:hypothetical protein
MIITKGISLGTVFVVLINVVQRKLHLLLLIEASHCKVIYDIE